MFVRRWALFALTVSTGGALGLMGVESGTALAQVNAAGTNTAPYTTTPAGTLSWQPTLEEAKRLATQSNRLILVHFWAPGNIESQELEQRVYSQPHVQHTIHSRFVPLRLNVEDFPTTAKQHGVDRVPTDVIITPAGQIVGRVNCPLNAESYLQQLMASAGSAGATPIASSPAYPPTPAPTVASSSPTIPSATQNPTPPQAASSLGPRYQTPPVANPSPAIVSAPPAAAAAPPMTAPQPKPPAVAAYSNDRYNEFFTKYGSGQTPPTTGAAAGQITNAQVAANTIPTTALTLPQVQLPATPTAPPTINPSTAGPRYASVASEPQVQMPAPPTTPTMPTAPTAPAANTAGLEGYCPVTLKEQKRWQVGDRRWGVVHRGRTYLFAGPMEQKKFLDNPDFYSPAISGQDVVLAVDYNQAVMGKRQYGVEYQNRIYLFANEASRQRFVQNGQRYAAEALQAENPTGTVLR